MTTDEARKKLIEESFADRGDKMITITLEGNTWEDLLQEISIIQECARRASSAPRIEDLPELTNIAKDCQKCQGERQAVLRSIMRYCSLGPEEMAEILERMR